MKPHRSNPSLSATAASGVAWLTISTIVIKIVAFGAQIVLAWLLLPDDFGLIALATTAAAFTDFLGQLGMGPVLIQRGPRIMRWSAIAVWMSVATGLLGGAALVAAAPLAANLYDEPRLVGLILVMALAIPLRSLQVVPNAILASQLRFNLNSGLTVGFTVASTLMTVALAWAGFGAYSFVIPRPIIAGAQLITVWLLARPRFDRRPRFAKWKYLLGDSLIVTLTSFVAQIIMQGDYVVLGIFATTAVVGQYYFAFALSMQTIAIFSNNLNNVLFATLSRLRDQPQRQTEAFLRGAQVLAYIVIPICLLQAALAEPVVTLVFDAKWRPAIPILQVLSVGMALRAAGWSSGALMQAQGRFKTRLILTASNSVGFVLLVLAGTWWRPGLGTAVGAAAFFTLVGPLNFTVAIRQNRGSLRLLGEQFAVPLGLGLTAAGLGWLAARPVYGVVPPPMADALVIAVQTAVTLAIYGLLVRYLRTAIWRQIQSLVVGLVHRAR